MCLNCHVVAVKVEMNDPQAILHACRRLGWTFKQGQKTYKWYKRWVDDSPVPRHLFKTQEEYDKVVAMTRSDRCDYMAELLGKCSHAIRVPGADFEIGVIQNGGQFSLIWDWYSTGGLNTIMGQDGLIFTNAYTVERTKLEAARQGQLCTEHQLADGSIQLRIQVGDHP